MPPPGPHRIGLLYPGHAAEDDYPAMQAIVTGALRHHADGSRCDHPVEFPLVHTAMNNDDHLVAELLDVGRPERLAAGTTQLQGDVQAVMWACTSGSFVFGWEGARTQSRRLAAVAQVPASSTSLAFVAALAHLGLRSVAIAATYPAELAGYFPRLLTDAGFRVAHATAAGVFTASQAGSMDADEVRALALRNDHPRAQALLLPDTALHTVALIPELEQRLGKSVLTANQVTAWYGLALAGVTVKAPRLGSLFTAPRVEAANFFQAPEPEVELTCPAVRSRPNPAPESRPSHR